MKRHALVQPRWLALCVMNALCLGVAPLALAQSTPPVPYTLTWIPNLTGTSAGSAAGVNNAVQAIGSLRNASGTYAAFLFNNGAPAPLELTPLSGTLSSVAAGINSASTAVGTRTLSVAVSRKSSCTITHAFVYTSQMVDIGTLNNSQSCNRSAGFAINSQGQVVGSSSTGTNVHPFLISAPYTPGTMQDLGTLNGPSGLLSQASAFGINSSGQVVGTSLAGGTKTPAAHAFLTSAPYAAANMQDLGALGSGSVAVAYGVNDSGAVVGVSALKGLQGSHAFLTVSPYGATQRQDLYTLAGQAVTVSSTAYAINNANQIVGASSWSTSNPNAQHAFVYQNGAMTDLNTLMPASQLNGGVLTTAYAIDNNGDISGTGTLANGVTEGFIAAPFEITSISPNSGAANTSNLPAVTLTGDGFVGATSVNVTLGSSSTSVTNFSVSNNGTQISFVPPAEPAGSYAVTVSNASVTTNAVTYTYVMPTPLEQVLYAFKGAPNDGVAPYGGLIQDASGNLYGTTYDGGDKNDGTVFELTPNGSGGYTETLLYQFQGGNDGANPAAGVIQDASGNLYGTTYRGGAGNNSGTVFKLAPNLSGGYTESVIYTFSYVGNAGAFPYGGLIQDASGNGNLYGTASVGGDSGDGAGTVFKLAPNGSGGYTESTLYTFLILDGSGPRGTLLQDTSGNLYGTTSLGGDLGTNSGTVFKLAPNGLGGYTESVLYSFTGSSDGSSPAAGVIQDTSGNLYGTTLSGGASNNGTVFKLALNGSGGYTESVLHAFTGGRDGNQPLAGLLQDESGNLYGTTYTGGASNVGTVFKLAPNGSGGYTENVLYAFMGGNDGALPYAGVIQDTSGNLYGTTINGGVEQQGTVFKITP
ncbi:choice-of-anchor tandem repeat GloVer-containing protein [Dyella sp. M7H15-1]|uniref:choice-of-anchor tandem repeat GloVer-containing protein n=1 Tax=Dyella sp. M7H15-1 TaxID=2501295 RepID=UPI0013E8D50A|nr:choice-of-anchor tandem repeat GloVer-containing protein [Dyella sp. M7H15-1]